MDVEHLDIVVGAEGLQSTIASLEKLADSLLDVAEAQSLVDEHMRIRVNDRDVDEAAAKMAGLAGTQRMVPQGPAMASGGGATADGGGTGAGGGLSPNRLRIMMREFGDVFDADELLRSRGVIGDPLDLVEGDMAEFFDTDEMARLVSDGVLDADVFEDPFDNLGALRRRGLVDLPENRGLFRRFEEFAGGINAQQLHNLFASLVPMLITFIGALPAAIAGLIALAGAALGAAAALGGVAGIGALGLAMDEQGQLELQNLVDTARDVLDDFLAAFGPLAEQLQPLFERGLDGLSRFFDALAARGDVLTEFADEAIAFGGWLSSGLVNVLSVFTQLADAAGETFGAIAEGLDAASAAEFLAFVMAETLPALARFVGVMKEVTPAIISLSAGFLDAAAMTILFIDLVGGLIATFLTLGGIIPLDVIGAFIGLLLSALTVTALMVKANALLGGTWVGRVIPGIWSAITSLHAYIGTVVSSTIATYALTAAVVALVSVLTLGLGAALAGVASQVDLMGNNFSDAAEDLRRFNAERSNMGGFGAGPRGGSASTYVDVTQQTTIESTGDTRQDNRLARKAAYHNSKVTDRNFSS